MPHGRFDRKRRADERARHLRDEFLAGVEGISVSPGLIAAKPGGMPRPMAQLLKNRPIPVDLVMIELLERHRYEVGAGGVEGLVSANPDIGAGGIDQRLGMGNDLAFG